MGFSSVYGCLQELFPQIDSRLLRACAIEYSKDADAAVEVVLTEILPRMANDTESPPPPPPPRETLGTPSHLEEEVQEEEEASLLRRHRATERLHASESSVAIHAFGSASSSSANPPPLATIVRDIPSGSGYNSIYYDSVSSESLATAKTTEELKVVSLDPISHAQVVALHHFNTAKVPDELNGTAENDELILLGLVNKNPTSTRRTSYGAQIVVIPDVTDANVEACEGKSEEEGSKEPQYHSVGGLIESQYKNLEFFPEDAVCQMEPVSVPKHAPETDCSVDACAEYLNDIDTTVDVNHTASVVHDSSNENVEMTQSAQIGEIHILDQIIEDAKNNKGTLFSAMESVINTMKEVEEQEKAAEAAREEAARRSSDICRRVEELKKMIQSAKEANDMHAGEVYGERAILATEVRELQSRLLNLSDERDKSLAILDEMRRTLEDRLAAAELVREAAEHEDQEKVEPAYIALKEQEALMEKVVHESKVLQEQAEENSKLQEFLMNRGRVVDQLQGEIAVICQDVKLLKERFDAGVALSKSITIGQTSCLLASSSTSIHSSASSDRVSDDRETWNALKEANLGSSVEGSSPRSTQEDRNGTREEQKELSDEGWEICDQ